MTPGLDIKINNCVSTEWVLFPNFLIVKKEERQDNSGGIPESNMQEN